MAYNRTAVENFAKTYWNKPCDDNLIATNMGNISVTAKAAQFGAVGPGWEARFVRDWTGETLWFEHPAKGSIETDLHGDVLEDCTHYISRCLMQGGVNIIPTAWAGSMVNNLRARGDTKTLADRVPLAHAENVMATGVLQKGDVIAYWSHGMYQHMAVRVETDGMSCHTWSRYADKILGDDWRLKTQNYVYTFIHFSSDDPPLSTLAQISGGWWEARTTTGQWFYYLLPDGSCRWTALRPHVSTPPARDPDRSGYWFEVGGTLLVFWTASGSVEQYEFGALSTSYDGVWRFGSIDTAISISKLS